ncbi:MAG: DUF1579 family protein [Planctomycetota bacterium]
MQILRRLPPLILLLPLTLCSCQWTSEMLGLDEGPGEPEAAGDEAGKEASPREPGEGHRFLARLDGRFAAEGTIWPEGATRSTAWSGVCRNWLVLGGRFLVREQEATSSGLGSMESLSLLGFDNSIGKYVETGCDTFSTSLRPTSRGKLDPSGDQLHLVSTTEDPDSGQLIVIREVWTVVSTNEYRSERFEKRPGQKERRVSEVVYRRTE